jgi:hypothetical protein
VKVAVGRAHIYTEVDKLLGGDFASENQCPSLGVQHFEEVTCHSERSGNGYGLVITGQTE